MLSQQQEHMQIFITRTLGADYNWAHIYAGVAVKSHTEDVA